MYYTYILQSNTDHRFYIGCTEDIDRRFQQHNQGKVKSTKHRTPLILVKLEEYGSLSEARIRENYLKSLKGGNEFKKLIKQLGKSNCPAKAGSKVQFFLGAPVKIWRW